MHDAVILSAALALFGMILSAFYGSESHSRLKMNKFVGNIALVAKASFEVDTKSD